MAMMDAGMRGTHASRATTGGRDRGARQANRVSRGQHRVEELRQVRAEIALQLLDALHADLHGLPGGGMLAVRRPQAHELVVHLLGARRAWPPRLQPGPCAARASGMRGARRWPGRRRRPAERRPRREPVPATSPCMNDPTSRNSAMLAKRPIHWNTTSAAMNLAAAGTRESSLLSNMAALGPFPIGAERRGCRERAFGRTAVGLDDEAEVHEMRRPHDGDHGAPHRHGAHEQRTTRPARP